VIEIAGEFVKFKAVAPGLETALKTFSPNF
jgi:hypothetical protein